MRVGSPLTWTVAQHATAPVMALSLAVALAAPPVPEPLPVVPVDAAAQVEDAAIAFADELSAVPADATDRLCPRDQLEVRWSEPEGFEHGAHLTPVGPRPGAGTRAVNGIVVCGDSTWAYMGFEATRTATGWDVLGVPYLEEEHGDVAHLNLDAGPVDAAAATDDGSSRTHDDHDDTHESHVAASTSDGAAQSGTAPVPSRSVPVATVESGRWLAGLGPIEPYAAYDPQTTCAPVARPGTASMRDALLGAHPATRNLGITRACHIGGRSEHKEGRAFDWGAYVSRPVERAAVERFIEQLHATDADGNRHALARRMGVMYLVWNGRIWSAYRASEGWRPYSGPSPHTDHIHISLSRAGADGRTSFHTLGLAGRGVLGMVPTSGGTVPVATPVMAAPRGDAPSTPTASRQSDRPSDRPGPGRRPAPSTAPSPSPRPSTTTDATADPRPTAEDADRGEQRRREEQRREEQRREEEARRAAEQARKAEEQARKAADQDQKAEEQARRAAEREAAERQRAAEREARQEERSVRGRDAGPAGGRGKGRGGGRG